MKITSQKSPSVWQVVKSVAASMLGVQSQANYQRDFEQRTMLPYVVVGVIFVVCFVLTLIAIVSWVLPG